MIKNMNIKFSEKELIHLLYAWAAISFAFAMILGGGVDSLAGTGFLYYITLSGITVGVAFLIHELAHKVVAQKYGCWAEFRKYDFGLILAVLMSFYGFVFAAPGAVMIKGGVSDEENGKIAAAGPVINIILAILFFVLSVLINADTASSLIYEIVNYGFLINAWLALFNLIPFSVFDGAKIVSWSKPVWIILVIISGFLTFGM